MKAKQYFFILFLIISLNANSQIFVNRLGFGLNYMSLDLPDNMVFSPNINYEKRFKKKLFIAGKFSYVNYSRKDSFSKTLPENRFRAMFDLRPSFGVLKYKNSFLKLGAGPSLWYRKEKIVKQLSFSLTDPTDIIDYKYEKTDELNFGFSLYSELDVQILRNVSIVGNFGFSTFKKAGTSSILGLNVLYNFQ